MFFVGEVVTFALFLLLLSGVAWTVVYIAGIRIGFRDRSYAIPFWALALNITWELWHSVLGYANQGVTAQNIVNTVWFVFDVGILITYFRYGRRYFPARFARGFFGIWSAGVLLVAFVLEYMFIHEFSLARGAAYSAFLQNLLMSTLFIVMLVQRGGSEGQSPLIAWSKFIGTLAPTIQFGIVGAASIGGRNSFILVVGIIIAIFDIAYIVLLGRIRAEERSLVRNGTNAQGEKQSHLNIS